MRIPALMVILCLISAILTALKCFCWLYSREMNFIKKAVNKTLSSIENRSESIRSKTKSSFRSHNYDSSSMGAEQCFLHGHLLVDIIAAKDLPDMESWIAKLVDSKDVTDPFVDVTLNKAKLAKTRVILNSLDPVWNESYRIEVCHSADCLCFEVRDKDHAYAEFIGAVFVPTNGALIAGEVIEGWFPICGKQGEPQGDAQLQIRVQYVPATAVPKSFDVDCYFPVQRGCHMTLYQDAHCPQGLPQFINMARPDGVTHQPPSCWSDVYQAIMGAERLICITGWAVWDKLRLFRGSDMAIDGRTLGELLLARSNEGVEVYVMVWSEKTSGNIIGESGVMGTHDMETFNYFKGTRECNEFTDFLQNEFSTGTYTHHQKSIIADVANMAGPTPRRLIAFVGGLDLTGGRWDTPNHELFSTLLDEHWGDFRNSNAKSVPPEQGPRQPWHDIHSRVEGPIAHDVFLNFFERWNRQAGKYGHLNPLDPRVFDFDAPAPMENLDFAWNCQFFRSITSDSAIFDPRKTLGMSMKKGRIVEASIAQAYVQMIRNAENFIYIENQYFLGSAYAWLSDVGTNADHPIPAEIAQKIVDKIYAGERFCAYIVIPMFPEGDPTSAPIQEILYWQTRTIEMMYTKVGDALANVGSSAHPTDYLLFMCPGKREAPGPHLDRLEAPVESFAQVFRKSLRSPIYVHSKMMIVDDTYIIVGSANINQRSMAGTRDTEMAVGGWQPAFPPENPFGQVHIFRMSLWAEHFRHTDPIFCYPGTIECVQMVKSMAAYNWQMYSKDEYGTQAPGQLLAYPLNILDDGTIESLEGSQGFLDWPISAKVMGKLNAMIPQKLTT